MVMQKPQKKGIRLVALKEESMQLLNKAKARYMQQHNYQESSITNDDVLREALKMYVGDIVP
jgi:hypothetical protein